MDFDAINSILSACEDGEPHPADLSPMDSLVVMGLVELVEESDDWLDDSIPVYAEEVAWLLDNPF